MDYKRIIAGLVTFLTVIAAAGDFAHRLMQDIDAMQVHLRANDSRLDLHGAPAPDPAALGAPQ